VSSAATTASALYAGAESGKPTADPSPSPLSDAPGPGRYSGRPIALVASSGAAAAGVVVVVGAAATVVVVAGGGGAAFVDGADVAVVAVGAIVAVVPKRSAFGDAAAGTGSIGRPDAHPERAARATTATAVARRRGRGRW
jgi:hypothetical protein